MYACVSVGIQYTCLCASECLNRPAFNVPYGVLVCVFSLSNSIRISFIYNHNNERVVFTIINRVIKQATTT